MRETIKLSLFVFFLHFCFSVNAQQQDFQSRFGLDASGDITKDIGWSAKVQQRWRYNSSVNDRTLLQAGVGYSPVSFLKLGMGYRGSFIYMDEASATYKQRFHVDVVADQSINRIKLIYRSRLQYGFDDFQTFSFVGGQNLTWRHRLALRYSPFGLPFRPQVSVELFQQFDHKSVKTLKGVRYIVGTEYLINQSLSINLDCILNKDLNVANPLTENILSLGLGYRF